MDGGGRFVDEGEYMDGGGKLVDVGLPFGCPTVTYQVHAKAQGGLVSP